VLLIDLMGTGPVFLGVLARENTKTIHRSGVQGSREPHGRYLGQVPPPELQFTPPAQLEAPPPPHETLQVVPLQLTVAAHEFWPEQRTVLLAAVVLTPPAHDRLPLQVMSH
jgi:hypothetical protein